MIKITFSINREIFRITINDKCIWYSDRKWNKAIRLIPKDEDFLKKIMLSRNAIPSQILTLFQLTDEELKQFNDAKDDEALAEICITDAKKKGALLIRQEED